MDEKMDEKINEKTDMLELTIQEAVAFFKHSGASVHGGYDTLVEIVGKDELRKGIPNPDYFHALYLTDFMLRRARGSLQMLAGQSANDFLEVLKDNFNAAVNRIIRNKGTVQIILLGNQLSSNLMAQKEQYGKRFEIELAQTVENKPIKHFIVCDDDCRDEELHDALDNNTPATAVKATVYFGNKTRSDFFSKKFENLWNFIHS